MRKVALSILNENLNSSKTITESTKIPPFIVDNLLRLLAYRGYLKVSETLADRHVYSISPSMKREFA